MKRFLPILLTIVMIATYFLLIRVAHPYAVAMVPTPVLYTKDFPKVFGGVDGKSLKFDDYGEIDEVEFVALPGTAFRITRDIWRGGNLYYRVSTDDYPYPTEKGYYVDARFVRALDAPAPERPRSLPSAQDIMQRMLTASGSIYTWGGNVNHGIRELISYYPPSSDTDAALRDQWMLKGVDCSGLLYEATDGFTPRNTSSLVEYGEAVDIAGLTAEDIAATLQPLDLIVWKGHLIIVMEDGKTIESRLDYDKELPGFQGGVRVRPLLEVLEETLVDRVAVNNYDDPVPEDKKKFVVRRWYATQQ